MPDDSANIDAKILLEHMQAMERRLTNAIGVVQTDVTGLKNDIAKVDQKLDTLVSGVDEMDQRLDTLEIKRVPRIEKHVGLPVFTE